MIVGAAIGACASVNTHPDGSKRTPLQVAEVTYVQASMFYGAGMDALTSLRAQGKVTDDQWRRIDAAQVIVLRWIPQYSSLLRIWRATGAKPEGFDAAAFQVQAAAESVAQVLVEVRR